MRDQYWKDEKWGEGELGNGGMEKRRLTVEKVWRGR